MQQWQAEFILDPEVARDLIESQFPALKIAEFSLFGEGWDNYAFLVNRSILFRFPRREIALAGFAIEQKVLPALSDKLPLKIPVPKYIGIPTKRYPNSFVGYDFIAGITACRAALSRAERNALTVPLAMFLKQLHEIKDREIIQHLNPDPFQRFNIKWRLEKGLELLTILASKGIIKEKAVLQQYMENIEHNLIDEERAVVHGDLYARHLLLDARKQLVAVIDWGDMHYGTRAADLEILYDFIPKESHSLFIKEYGTIKEITLKLSLFRACYSGLILLNYANEMNDYDLLKEALQGIDFVLENIK